MEHLEKKFSKVKNEKISNDTITFYNLSKISKNDAIKKYGKPIKYEKFILNDGPLEFRIELLNFYTKEEIQSNSIEIEECTWEKDKDTWITAWYQINSKESTPKDIYIWKKGTEF